jgi:RNA binding exosome subunit
LSCLGEARLRLDVMRQIGERVAHLFAHALRDATGERHGLKGHAGNRIAVLNAEF